MHRLFLGTAVPTFPWLVLLSIAHPQADGPAIPTPRLEQADIEQGQYPLDSLRGMGLRLFSTPFNRHDGYGDGPWPGLQPMLPGQRPTLQNNGTFLRVNGLDAQSCAECHTYGSTSAVPFRFAIGGSGSANNNVFAGGRTLDPADQAGHGYASFDGRFINPPFLFGAGGVELAGLEMTQNLQALRSFAQAFPDQDVPLVTHGIDFGVLRYDSPTQRWDTSRVEGIDEDLVVRPFGRKGEFATVRSFAAEAMGFHFGMQPSELVGNGVDEDQDGVVDEIRVGELSALHAFVTQLEGPELRDWNREARHGANLFVSIGCSQCHIPTVRTVGRELPYRFPEVETDPTQNVYLRVDLSRSSALLARVPGAGIELYALSDFKRHDLGAGLADRTGQPGAREFLTARLWGVADSGPYLHDGRATTLTDAILWHGGEALASRQAFEGLRQHEQVNLITFLKRHRTPEQPSADLLR